jgi:dTDP-4-amino-4,6-dideoxygalactose transaminase/acetyltransferase-like isoleucine patch superfamily enzyme
MNQLNSISDDVKLGENVRLSRFINLYGCQVGDESRIGAFVEIQKNARVGRRCKISSHSFICEGVTIEDNVFIGHGVMFINDTYPRATNPQGQPQSEADWRVEPTVVGKGASIGSNATILSNIRIGDNAIIGAGSVVTKDVPPGAVVAGNPAKILRYIEQPQEAPADANGNGAIPFLDLITPHKDLEEELVSVFRDTLRTAGFVGGSVVSKFEEDFAKFSDTDYAIAVNSGTDALRFAIMACGIEAGDVVLTVPNTFIATTEAISQARAIPEFVDIDERTYNMSPQMLERYLEKQCVRNHAGKLISLRSGRPVTAVIPVHLYGQMADMDAILALAEKFGLTVIEDACQAHGAEYFSNRNNRWMRAGSMGRAAAFSFYPGKNLGACGEGGAATTSDPDVATKIKMLRDHGQVKKYFHDLEGYNGRLDSIQCGFLQAKLPFLGQWNMQRREHASVYNKLLSGHQSLTVPFEPSWSKAVYHLYVIRANDREGLMSHLAKKGIGVGIHYPIPLHVQKAYMSLNYSPGDFPVTQRVATEILSLPMFPQLRESQQMRVADEIHIFLQSSAFNPDAVEDAALAQNQG